MSGNFLPIQLQNVFPLLTLQSNGTWPIHKITGVMKISWLITFRKSFFLMLKARLGRSRD